ncbi:MAG: CU044_5270 family protein [Streptosporangiaceae bacterium]
MNELDLLTQLRDEVPLTEPSPAVEHAFVRSLRAGQVAGAAHYPSWRPPRLVVAAAVAASIAVATAAVLTGGLSGHGSLPPRARVAPSGAALRHVPPPALRLGRARTEAQLVDYATRSAAAAPANVPGPHEWVYVKTEDAQSSAGGGGFLFGPPDERVIGQEWTRVDQRMFAGYVHGHLQFSPGGPGTTLGGWKSISPSYMNSLPTDPARLEAIILASNRNPKMPWYVGRNKAYTIFNGIFILISDGQSQGTWIPPKLEAAMYRILASLPGVHFDRTTDLAGRHGMGFYMLPGGWEKQELVINPVTYAYMGFEWVALKAHTDVGTDGTRHIKKGQVLGWGALLKVAVVQKAGQLP